MNTVAFADETGNVIYSGSDDNLCKVLSGSSLLCSPFLSIIILPLSNSVSIVEMLRDVSFDKIFCLYLGDLEQCSKFGHL